MRKTVLGMLLIALLACAFLYRDIPAENLVLRVLAGVGAGLMIAYVPGFMSTDIRIKYPKFTLAIRATGALAAGVLIYLVDPGSISALLRNGK